MNFLSYNSIRVIDETNTIHTSPIHSFAMDDALCLSVSANSSLPTARLWVHEKTIVLGIPDSRLPYLEDGIAFLEEHGYRAIIRNSGGLAVVLDGGVLNLSFIFPDAKKLSIHTGYEAMVAFIQELFKEEKLPIEAFEIKGSYCPGDYDLSIHGKKFAGISQRRVKDGSAVQIYLCVEGSGSDRAALVKEFYNRSLKGETGTFTYPEIVPDTMASLQELFNRPISVSEVRDLIWNKLQQQSNIVEEPFTEQEQEWYEKRLEQMKKRNERLE